jgi:hypothetical protein
MHVPGMMSIKVLDNGLHCTQGMTAAGIAKIARVIMVKYTYFLIQPSAKRSRVTPKAILLNVMAKMDIESPDAP